MVMVLWHVIKNAWKKGMHEKIVCDRYDKGAGSHCEVSESENVTYG